MSGNYGCLNEQPFFRTGPRSPGVYFLAQTTKSLWDFWVSAGEFIPPRPFGNPVILHRLQMKLYRLPDVRQCLFKGIAPTDATGE